MVSFFPTPGEGKYKEGVCRLETGWGMRGEGCLMKGDGAVGLGMQ